VNVGAADSDLPRARVLIVPARALLDGQPTRARPHVEGGQRLWALASQQKDSCYQGVREEKALGTSAVDHRRDGREQTRLLGLQENMQRTVRGETDGSGTSPSGAIIEDGNVGVLCGGTGQNLAFAAAKIPGGDDWIDSIHSHCAERIKTVWVDRSWPPRNFGEHPAGDNQRVAKLCE